MMSITKEHAAKLNDKPAIVCCRTVKGTVIGPADLEDPAIFSDLEESGLVSITAQTLTIGEVLGAVLKKDIDALTSLTSDVLDGVKAKASAPAASHADVAPKAAGANRSGGMFYFKADKADGIEISFPLGGYSGEVVGAETAGETVSDEVARTLVKNSFAIKEVRLGE
jgi:D-proline reductase (dithiol) PrdA